MRLRWLLLFPAAALPGAALAVLPALGSSPSGATLEVNENCNGYIDWPCWTSPGAKPEYASLTTIASGGVITFADHSVATNVAWTGTAPTCSPSVPVSPAPAKTGWEGTCTFEAPGTYKFESSSLYATYTKYEVVVSETGTSGTTSTSTGTGTTGTGAGTTGTGTTGKGTTTGGDSSSSSSSNPSTPGSGSQTPTGGGSSGSLRDSGPVGSLFAGGASGCKLAATQHGQSVRGSVDVSQAAAGGRLEVQLLATRASLASAGHSARAQVGRLVRSALRAGTHTFVVPLNDKATRALHGHGHLAVTVKVVITSPRGAAATVTRSVVLRA